MNNLSGSEEATVQHIKDNVTKSENGKYVLPKEVSLGVGLMVRVALAKEGIVIKHDNCQTPVLAFSTKKVLRSEYDERVERRKEEADTNRIVQKVESESAPVATKRGLKGFPYFEDIYDDYHELEPGASKEYIEAFKGDMAHQYYQTNWDAHRKHARKMYKEFMVRACKAYGFQVPTNKEENKQFHQELDKIKQQRKQKEREENEMKESKKAALGELLASGSVVKEMTVDKKDIINLMKEKMQAKVNGDMEEVRKLKNQKQEERDNLWKEILAVIKKVVGTQTSKAVDELNKALDTLGFKQKVGIDEHELSGKEWSDEELDGTKPVSVTITTDFGKESSGRHKMLFMSRHGFGGCIHPMEMMEMMHFMEEFIDSSNKKGACLIVKTIEVTLPKEVKEMNAKRKAIRKEQKALDERENVLHRQRNDIERDASKFTTMLTEQVLESTVDGKKVLDMVNQAVEAQYKNQLPA